MDCINKELLVDVNCPIKLLGWKSVLNKVTQDVFLFGKSFQKAWTSVRNSYIKNLCNA